MIVGGCRPPATPDTVPGAEAAVRVEALAPTAGAGDTSAPAVPSEGAPHDNPHRPADVPPAAPATLSVNDLVGHPARWNAQSVVVIGRLRHVTDRCTKAVPPSCTGHFQLYDAHEPKPMTVRLLAGAQPVPVACRVAASELVAWSPCEPQEVDPTRCYRVEGALAYDARGARFSPTRVEVLPVDSGCTPH